MKKIKVNLNIVKFAHLEEIALKKDPHARLKTVSAETKDILQELEKDYKAPEKKEDQKEVGMDFNTIQIRQVFKNNECCYIYYLKMMLIHHST